MPSSLTVYRRKSPVSRVATSTGFTAHDMAFPIATINVTEISLTKRYPETGWALNKVSDMVVKILEGRVVLYLKAEDKIILSKGDTVHVPKNTPYCWQPRVSVKMFVVSTPPWNEEQQTLLP